jgi:hypothetical protein
VTKWDLFLECKDGLTTKINDCTIALTEWRGWGDEIISWMNKNQVTKLKATA